MGVMDANSAGSVHGGAIMRYCDEAAGLAATRHSGHRVVTVAMDRMTFLVPIRVGEVVTFKATVNAAWHSSMEVGVRVEAEDPWSRRVRHTNSAYLTMVALDDDASPAQVPALECETREEERREREAQVRRANRLAEREQILKQRGS
jgi:acyl-CoA hydrolase